MKNQCVTLLAAAALACAPAALAQKSSTGSAERMTNPHHKNLSSADRTFMMKAAQGGQAEVKLGNLAQSNGQSQAVKDFGQRMVTDHGKANDQLKNIASQMNVNLPSDLSAKDQATYDRLSKLHGPAFDKAYMRDMVSDHKMDIAEFNRESRSGHDTDVKNFASSTLPTLHSHLTQAESTYKQVLSGK